MGREIKRVPLDFKWELNKVWTGYLLSPCCDDCDDCKLFAKIKNIPLTDTGCPDIMSIFEPPKGDGYQIWETTSEGSPITPVFDTPEKLAKWAYENNTSSFGHYGASYETWLKFIKGPGWAPTMIMSSKGIQSGVEGL